MLAYIPQNDRWLVLLHVASAFVLVGGLVTVVVVSVAAARVRIELVPLLRAVAFRVTLLAVIPAFVAVHVFGGMLADREFPSDEPGWVSTGFALTSIATIVAVLLVFLQFWVLRRLRGGVAAGWPAAAATWLPPLLLAAMVAVLVLMAGKPAG